MKRISKPIKNTHLKVTYCKICYTENLINDMTSFVFFNHLIKARSIFKHMHAILIIIVATVTIKNCNDGFLRPIRDQTSIISI